MLKVYTIGISNYWKLNKTETQSTRANHAIKEIKVFLVVQWVKDLALSLQKLRSLLWHGFIPWPKNFHMPQALKKKKKKKKEREREKKWKQKKNQIQKKKKRERECND